MSCGVGVVTLVGTCVLAMVMGCEMSSLGGSLVVALMMRVLGCLVVEGGVVAGLIVLGLPCCGAVCITASEQGKARREREKARRVLKMAANIGMNVSWMGVVVDVVIVVGMNGVGGGLGM